MTPNSSPGGHRDHLGGATNEPSALTQRPAGSGRLRSAARGSAAASAARDAPCATWRSCLHRPEHPGLSPTTGHEPRALATQRTSHHAHSRLNSLDTQVFGTGTSSSTTERRSRRRGGCSASPIARPPTPPLLARSLLTARAEVCAGLELPPGTDDDDSAGGSSGSLSSPVAWCGPGSQWPWAGTRSTPGCDPGCETRV